MAVPPFERREVAEEKHSRRHLAHLARAPTPPPFPPAPPSAGQIWSTLYDYTDPAASSCHQAGPSDTASQCTSPAAAREQSLTYATALAPTRPGVLANAIDDDGREQRTGSGDGAVTGPFRGLFECAFRRAGRVRKGEDNGARCSAPPSYGRSARWRHLRSCRGQSCRWGFTELTNWSCWPSLSSRA